MYSTIVPSGSLEPLPSNEIGAPTSAAVGFAPLVDFFEGPRKRFLAGRAHPALVPFEKANGTIDYWPPQSLSKLAKQVERIASELAGRPIRFQWRDTRPTFGQLCIDDGADIQDVSVGMRHRSTRTTEQYYARQKPKRAFANLRRARAGPPP